MNPAESTSVEAIAMILAILFAETQVGELILGLGGAGGLAGLVAWVLKSALPGLMEMFGAFLDKLNAGAKADREAAKADRDAAAIERKTLMESHVKQVEARDHIFTAELERRDRMLAAELAKLTDAVRHSTEANARTTAVVESLSSTVAALAARVGVEPEPAPPPRPKRG